MDCHRNGGTSSLDVILAKKLQYLIMIEEQDTGS